MTKRVYILSSLIIATLFFSVLAVTLPVNAQGPDREQVVVAFGKVPGQDLYAHVWVVIPQGADKNQIVNESLRQQGLKPFDHSDFKVNGMVHDQFKDPDSTNDFFVQYYNPANDPTGVDHLILQASQEIWTDVLYSNFAFMAPDTNNDLITDRCPSAVRECPGKQYPDTFNDVAWMPIKDKNTLGVTWFYPNLDEADMALNTKFTWIVDSNVYRTYDPLTVLIHENGHVLGLTHSDVPGSVMEAIYDGVRQELSLDDKCGIQSIYGIQESACTTTESPAEPSDAVTADIDYKVQKGKRFGGLIIDVVLKDDTSQTVSNTLVEIELFLDGNSVGTADNTTNSEGKAGFRLSNPPNGDYSTTVLKVAGVDWDDVNQTNDPGFKKE